MNRERLHLVSFPLCDCCFHSYVGHGAGARYLDSGRLLKGEVRAAALLFGCSSAALSVNGLQEGTGIVLNYISAGW